MASFSIIPYLGPPAKPSRSCQNSKITVEKEQGRSPLQDIHQVCPGDDPNRSQLVCSFRSSMNSRDPSELGPAQHGTETEPVTRQIQLSSSSSRDQHLFRVDDSAQKDELHYSDWGCSSRSSTISTELSGKTQQADQSENYHSLQVSVNKQQRKRKASIANSISDTKGDQGKDLHLLLLSR